MKLALVLAGMTAMASPAFAEIVARAASPDGKLTLAVSLDNDGRPSYSIARDGKAVLNDSRLGFLFTDAPKIERNLVLARTTRDRSDTT
jgi:alpha-glucosidase